MATNVEIKATVQDFAAVKSKAENLCGGPGEVINQEDTFFFAPKGRLKLRIIAGKDGRSRKGQLIHYHRTDAAGPKRSDYIIFETGEPDILKEVLGGALGLRGVVRKQRRLYWVGQTRIHLDQVEGLGSFLELEVVLRPDQPADEGEAIAIDLMYQLGIDQGSLIENAYIDLLEERGH
jgi:predicted adenylyl cyclase CyaB